MWREGPAAEIAAAFMRAPMLRAVLPFIVGLLIARGVGASPAWMWPLALVAAVVFVLVTRRAPTYADRWKGGLALAATMGMLGGLWHAVREVPVQVDPAWDDASATPWLVEVVEPGKITIGMQRHMVRLLAVAEGTNVWSVEGRVLLTLRDSALSPLSRGARLWVTGTPRAFDRVPDPGGFDQAQWAASKGLVRSLFVREGDALILRNSSAEQGTFARWRGQLLERMDRSGLPPQERALAKALVLGFRDELTPEQRDGFVRSGTMHVLALSGLHVGILYAVLQYLLAFLGQRTWARVGRGAFVLLAIWGYALLTGASPSVMRASIMFSLFAVAGMVGRGRDALNSLAAAAFLLLLIDPAMLRQLGFQFSFLAVLGIILFYDPMRRSWEPPHRWITLPWSIICVSIAAQVMTTPLALFTFNAFPTWFLPANILVVSGIGLIVYGIALTMLLGPLPLVGPAVAWVVAGALHLVAVVADGIAQWPLAYPGVRVTADMMLLLYVLILLGASWLIWRRRLLLAGSGLTLFLLLLLWGRAARDRSTTRELIVHDRRGHLTVTRREGRTAFVHSDTLFTARQREQLERGTGVHTLEHRPFDEVAEMEMIPGLPWKVLLLQGKPPAAGLPFPIDVAVLNSAWDHAQADLLRVQPPRLALVLSPTLAPRDRYRARRFCEEQGLACHDVRAQGAFILSSATDSE